MIVSENGDFMASDNYRLLEALAEQLKLPFMHISQHAELIKKGVEPSFDRIETLAGMALELIDGFLLSQQISLGQLDLALEPVSVSSVLQESANKLQNIAREYNCEVQLHLGGKYNSVMAHRESLEAAITSLGYSLIESQGGQQKKQDREIILAAYRNGYGVIAGAYCKNSEGISKDAFNQAKELYGKARQTVPSLGHTPNAGIFIADMLLRAMSSRLRFSKHRQYRGLAATFSPNRQLELISV